MYVCTLLIFFNTDSADLRSITRSASIKAEEARKARALIFITVMMAVSNIPRMLMSLHEAFYIIPNYFKDHPK